MSVQDYALLEPIAYPDEKNQSPWGTRWLEYLCSALYLLLPKLHRHLWSLLWIAKRKQL